MARIIIEIAPAIELGKPDAITMTPEGLNNPLQIACVLQDVQTQMLLQTKMALEEDNRRRQQEQMARGNSEFLRRRPA